MRHWMSDVSHTASAAAIVVLALGLLPRPVAATAADDQKAWQDLLATAAAAGRQPPPGPTTAGSCAGVSLLGVCSDMPIGATALSMRVASAPLQTAIDKEQAAKGELDRSQSRVEAAKTEFDDMVRRIAEFEADRARYLKSPDYSEDQRASLLAWIDGKIASNKKELDSLTKQASSSRALLAQAQSKHAEAVQALKAANSQPGAYGAAK